MNVQIQPENTTIIIPHRGVNIPVSDAVSCAAEILPSRFNSTSSPRFDVASAEAAPESPEEAPEADQ